MKNLEKLERDTEKMSRLERAVRNASNSQISRLCPHCKYWNVDDPILDFFCLGIPLFQRRAKCVDGLEDYLSKEVKR